MSVKNFDRYERWRSVSVSFRASPEESEMINTFVKLSGLTKQEYIIQKLLNHDVTVQPNPRVYKALKDQLSEVLDELKRIESGEQVSGELIEIISMISNIMNGLK